MLRIFSAASGEEVATVSVSELDANVSSLRQHLAKLLQRSKFQLRLLSGAHELQEEESLAAPMDIQLLMSDHLPPEPERDQRFFDSCVEGRADEVRESLIGLQNPNLDMDDNALLLAVERGHPDVVHLLLEAGATTEWLDGDELDQGRGALHAAADEGFLEITRLLLHYGAEKDAANCSDALTPLHYAAKKGHVAVVRLLLEYGAEKDAEDAEHLRPLHMAAEEGHASVVRVLLDFGADKEGVDLESCLPSHLCGTSPARKRLRP